MPSSNPPGTGGFESGLDAATRRAIFDLKRQIGEGGGGTPGPVGPPGPAGPAGPAGVAPPRIGGRWRRVAALSLAQNVFTSIPWDTEDEDTHNFVPAGGNTFTIPAGQAGVYMITASTNGVGPGTGSMDIVGLPNAKLIQGTPQSPFTGWMTASGVVYLPVGGEFTVRAVQNGVTTNTPANFANLEVWKIAA